MAAPDDAPEVPPAPSPRDLRRGRWQPPEPAELQPSFPQYEIRGLLGRGGMGAVYRGWHRTLERDVAIKILPAFLQDHDANFAQRFQREARALARLTHPGIVTVHDAGQTADGLLYYVMEYIEGTDVWQIVRQEGVLAPEHALAITAHVCDALAYAHQRGIIHRDIKPSNIMVDLQGQVKVADFGLAKVLDDPHATLVTDSGVNIGTPEFIAPEVIYGGIGQVDHRADLYAVGVMLYQMLTGALPHGLVRLPSERRPGLDRRFDEIVSHAMEENPADRYGSATELREDLDKILSQPVPPQGAGEPTMGDLETVSLASAEAMAGGSRRSKIAVYGGLAAGVVLVAGALGFVGWKPSHQPAPPVATASETPTPSAPEAPRAAATGEDARPSAATPAPPPSTPPDRPLISAASATPAPGIPTPAPTPAPATPAIAAAASPITPPAPTPAPATPKPLSEMEKWLAQVDEPQQAAYRRDVLAPYDAAVKTLSQSYLTTLDQRIAAASTAGKLDLALGWREERQQFLDAGQALPPDDTDLTAQPAAGHRTAITSQLLPLRAQSRTQLARLERDRATRAQTAFAKYDAILSPGIVQLTQRQRFDDALLLKNKLEALRTAWLGTDRSPAVPAAQNAPSAGETPVPQPAAAATAPHKGDDRAATLMILGKGGTAVIEANRQRREVKAPEDLPKGSFDVLELRLQPPGTQPPVPISEEEMQSLAGLKRLERLAFRHTALSNASLSVLRTLPKLTALYLDGNDDLTDEGLVHLAALKQVTELSLGGGHSSITSAGILHLAPLQNLQNLQLGGLPYLDDKAIPGILKMRKLRNMQLLGSPNVNKSFLEALGGLPELNHLMLDPKQLSYPVDLNHLRSLRSLEICGFAKRPVDGAVFDNLAGLKTLDGIVFLEVELTEPQIQQVIKRLPSLKKFSVSSVQLPPSGLAALQGSKITTAGAGAIDTRFDDAALQSLIPIKSLKTVTLARNSPITEAGLAAFKKARPDVKIEEQ